MAGPSTCGDSSGDVGLPCPFADIFTDHLEPRVAIALLGDPKLRRANRLSQVQQFHVAAKVQKHPDLPGLRLLGHLEDQKAVGRVAAHDGHKDHPVGGEVALMESEGGRSGPGRIGPGRFLLHKAADAVGAFPGCQLFCEAPGRFGAAVGVADKRALGRGVDDG